MRRTLLSLLGIAGTALACGRQPCETGEAELGPSVRLDVALHTCNATPIARISAPSSVEKNAQVMVDGSASSDDNGDPLGYRWELLPPEGSEAQLERSDGAMTTFQVDREGTYELVLRADDGELTSEPARHLVVASNRAPTANAGVDFGVAVGAIALLDGSSSSDPDADALSFEWTIVDRPAGSTAVIDAPNAARAGFIGDVRGVFVVSLRVGDGALFAEDMIRVGAGFGGNAPVASAGPDATIEAATPVILDGSGSSDPDGDPLTYEWRIVEQPGGGGQLRDATTARATFNPNTGGRFVIELWVSDGFFEDTDTVEITATLPPPGQVNVGHCSGGGNIIVFDGDEDEDLTDDDVELHDYIHPGRETLTGGMFTGRASDRTNDLLGDVVSISFRVDTRFWDIDLATAPDAVDPLTTRVYEDGQRYPFNDPGHPGLSIFGDGRGCNTLTGSFRIYELQTSTVTGSLELERLTATFSQHCGGGEAELRGCVHFER